MLQWFLEWLRHPRRDHVEAVQKIQDAADTAYQHALAACDTFVPHLEDSCEGLLIGTAATTKGELVPVRLPWDSEYVHWLVQGGTGTGKTTWITGLLTQALQTQRPVGVLDCKGDLYRLALRWVAALGQECAPADRERLRHRLVVVNPFGEALVPLNVCRPLPGVSPETQAYEITLALGRLFDQSLGLHMENLLRHLILLLIEAELSLAEAPLLLQDDLLRDLLVRRSANPQVREFFLSTYPGLPQVSKDALLNRLQGLFLAENLRLMLGADRVLDFKGILDRGDPVVMFLGRGSVPEEQVATLGSLLVQLLLQATYARGTGQARGYLMMMDEFFHLLDAPGLQRRFETALTTVRSFGLSCVLIHHNFAQLQASLREIILTNTDIQALFRMSSRNADLFGDILPETDPDLITQAFREGKIDVSREEARRHQRERLQRLPNRCCYWNDRRKPHRAIKLELPTVPAPHEVAGLTEQALENRIRDEGWDRGGAAVSRDELRAQLAARRQRLQALSRPTRSSGVGQPIDQGRSSTKTRKGPNLG